MIKLTRGYFVEFDEYNYVLKQKRLSRGKKNQGEEVEVVVGYYGRIYQLVRGLQEHVFRSESKEIDTLEAIQKNMDDLTEEIRVAFDQSIHELKVEFDKLRKENSNRGRKKSK